VVTAILALSLLLAGLSSVEAQPAPKVYRIGYLSYLGCSDDPFLTDAFRQGLRDLGYVEGRNVVIECRGAPGQPDRYPGLVAELVRQNVDVLVAAGTILTLAAKRATTRVPIVMVYIGDPVGSGLVSSLARPGANVTGLSMLASEMVQKGFEALKEAAPTVSRVAVLIDSSNPGQTLPDRQLATAAKVLGVRPARVELRTSADLDVAFAAILKQRAEALFVYPVPITRRDSERLAQFALKHRLPTATVHEPFFKAGLLICYVTDIASQYRRAGMYIDRILKGVRPADLPVEQAEKFDLLLNLKTAKSLGLPIPQSLLLRADRVVE
jgi:putative ABC transport system substrate-binding protein